jgi:hypothetical protein
MTELTFEEEDMQRRIQAEKKKNAIKAEEKRKKLAALPIVDPFHCQICGKVLFGCQHRFCSKQCKDKRQRRTCSKTKQQSFQHMKKCREKKHLTMTCERCKIELTENDEYVSRKSKIFHKHCFDAMYVA